MFPQIPIHSAIYGVLGMLSLLGLVQYNPRLILQDYRPDIKAVVPPKSDAEKRLSIRLGMPFLLVLLVYPIHGTFAFHSQSSGETSLLTLCLWTFGIASAFNLWDLLVLEWLIFCAITPRQSVIPGSEGHPATKIMVSTSEAF